MITKNPGSKDKEKLHIGGQAVIEGVMMKSKKNLSIAVRNSHKKITVKAERLNPISERIKIFKWPFLRGIVELFEILVIGIKALNYSANESIEKEEEKLSTFSIAITIGFAFFLAVAVFKFLPLLITWILHNNGALGQSRTLFNLVDGLLRILLFIAYILAISLMSDVKRLFQYHGAEHKTIHCYEAGEELTFTNIKKYPTLHTRCGTSFLFIVLIVAMIVFSIIKINIHFWLLFLYRIPLLLPIAGISYEVLKVADRFNHIFFMRWISKPGLLIQRITTKEPDRQQIEVAAAALKKVLALEKKS